MPELWIFPAQGNSVGVTTDAFGTRLRLGTESAVLSNQERHTLLLALGVDPVAPDEKEAGR